MYTSDLKNTCLSAESDSFVVKVNIPEKGHIICLLSAIQLLFDVVMTRSSCQCDVMTSYHRLDDVCAGWVQVPNLVAKDKSSPKVDHLHLIRLSTYLFCFLFTIQIKNISSSLLARESYVKKSKDWCAYLHCPKTEKVVLTMQLNRMNLIRLV